MKHYAITLRAFIEVGDDWQENSTGFVNEAGDELIPWVSLELNQEEMGCDDGLKKGVDRSWVEETIERDIEKIDAKALGILGMMKR